MIDAATYDEKETLKNGAEVHVRAVRADDKHRIVEAFRNLEAESVYTRFFHHKKGLSESDLKAATEVDFDNVVALVVTVGEGEAETIIAGARYVAFGGTPARRAEVAFTVEEDYHRQGIAGRLLRHLARIGREKGLERLEAEVLAGNKAMLAVFSRSGLPMTQHFESGTVHVSLELTA
jgi:RimJ/RimL family protein N-acetyltransferase